MLTTSIKRYSTVIVIVLLSIMFVAELTSAIQETQTIDEGTHLASGYSYLMKNDFRLNREHPPLLKELAALPLVIISPRLDSPFDSAAWKNADQWGFAQVLLYENSVSAETLLLLGRLPTMLISLLLGFFIYRWSKELFGTWAGLFSVALYAFSPNIIAHSRYVTTDIGMATLFFITIYYFYKYLKLGTPRLLWMTAIFFALAQAAKFSNVILVPVLLLLFLIAALYREQFSQALFTVKRFFSNFGIIFLTTVVILVAVYGFQFTKPLDDIRIQQLYQDQAFIIENNTIDQQDPLLQKIISYTNPATDSGAKIKSFFENVPLPLFGYIDGFAQLYTHNYFGHTAYLLGNHTEFGWWYYFPLAFIVKTPVITQLLLLMVLAFGLVWLWRGWKNKNGVSVLSSIPVYYYFLILPPVLYVLVSLTSSLNLGLRHIIMVYPFIFVLLGYLVKKVFEFRSKLGTYLLVGAVVLYAISSVLIYPHYLAYFNELSGGPDNGTTYLVDSNIDWGQDILHLKKYMKENDITHVCMAYFGQAKLEYFEIDYRYLPDNEHFTTTEEVDCVVAVSATALFSKRGEYKWLQEFTPDEKIGYSIFIYDFRNN